MTVTWNVICRQQVRACSCAGFGPVRKARACLATCPSVGVACDREQFSSARAMPLTRCSKWCSAASVRRGTPTRAGPCERVPAAAVFLAAMMAMAAGVMHASRAPPSRALASSPGPAPHLILVQESAHLDALIALCGGTAVVPGSVPCLGKMMMRSLAHACDHVYTHVLWGIAGRFMASELDALRSCFPGLLAEPDGQVMKAEGPQSELSAHRVKTDGDNDSVDSARQQLLHDLVGGESLQALAKGHLQDSPEALQQSAGGGGRGSVGFAENGSSANSALSHSQEQLQASPGQRNPGTENDMVQAATGIYNRKMQQLPPALWGLDRIDQRRPPLDHAFMYDSNASGVTIYALDSGVRPEHQEFESSDGGPSRATWGYDFLTNRDQAEDCDGHGTHVGATAIGRTVGVAKAARLVAVRVLDCKGSGSISDTVAGLDWVARHHTLPALVTMSLGVTNGPWSRALERGTLALVRQYGLPVVVASGNGAVDACSVSPASLREVITVAASSMDNKFRASPPPSGAETMYRWSNTGPCIDFFAPGVEIWSACGGASRCPVLSRDAYTWATGTSMAVPHVAGAVAMYLATHPTASPAQVKTALLAAATQDALHDSRLLNGTPNRLLFTGFISDGQPLVQAAG